VQFTNDFRLAEVLRTRPGNEVWYRFALGPSGADIYALRHPSFTQRKTELGRLPGVASARRPVRAEHVLWFDDLAQRHLWDRGLDLTRAVIGEYSGSPEAPSAEALAVAANGDIFVLAGAC
jgi:hypothetical protein